MPREPDEYRRQFQTSDEAYQYVYSLGDRNPRVEVYQEDDYWYVEKLLEEPTDMPVPRPLTTSERRVILQALSTLKDKVHPASSTWAEINQLWDAITTGKV